MKTYTVVLVADPDGGNLWAYACRNCRRIAMPYYDESAAQANAGQHNCAAPRYHERTEILDRTVGERFAGLLAAAGAAIADWTSSPNLEAGEPKE